MQPSKTTMARNKQANTGHKLNYMEKGFTIIELIVGIAIFAVILCIIISAMNSANTIQESKYEICFYEEASSQCEYVSDYDEINNCIIFNETKICGNYKIEKLKNYGESNQDSTQDTRNTGHGSLK